MSSVSRLGLCFFVIAILLNSATSSPVWDLSPDFLTSDNNARNQVSFIARCLNSLTNLIVFYSCRTWWPLDHEGVLDEKGELRWENKGRSSITFLDFRRNLSNDRTSDTNSVTSTLLPVSKKAILYVELTMFSCDTSRVPCILVQGYQFLNRKERLLIYHHDITSSWLLLKHFCAAAAVETNTYTMTLFRQLSISCYWASCHCCCYSLIIIDHTKFCLWHSCLPIEGVCE